MRSKGERIAGFVFSLSVIVGVCLFIRHIFSPMEFHWDAVFDMGALWALVAVLVLYVLGILIYECFVKED